MPQRVLVVNQYYAPDVASSGQLLAELCSGLSAHGLEVHVVAGQPSYTSSAGPAPSHEVLGGVQVNRVSLGKSLGREKLLTRLSGYLKFMRRAWREACRVAETHRPNVILTLSNPPFVGIIGALLARRYRLRYLYVLYDIHPDVLLATRWVWLPPPVVWAWNAMNRWILRRADTIVVPSESMRRTLVESKGVPEERVRVIPNWARPETCPRERPSQVRCELGIGEQELLLLYAGNIGIMQQLDPILEAAALLRGEPVRFLFLGDGANRQSLQERAEQEGLNQVTFLPFQPEERFTDLLAASDACFVSLHPGMDRFSAPSRAYTFLSAGRPLITIMPADTGLARLVTEARCGWNVSTGPQLADLVQQLAHCPGELASRGQRGRTVYEECFQREKVIAQYVAVLQDGISKMDG